jgi:hypothetical protein
MNLFGGKETCIDCNEDTWITICDRPGCLNQMCNRHSWLQSNGKHYCSECNEKYG